MIVRRIRFSAARKIPEPLSVPVLPTDAIIRRDDGAFALGWHDDAPGPFPSHEFAAAVAAKRGGAA